ncbi:hypothetical protein [Psychromonas ossibalaenae]|uniref:hypothetical protein n=1 Tax=Psychromonas ossibalaenae TaxID=444922 RepID=UPI0003624B62|nr:hypothetical protein [Psychromonas ossibalaenae]
MVTVRIILTFMSTAFLSLYSIQTIAIVSYGGINLTLANGDSYAIGGSARGAACTTGTASAAARVMTPSGPGGEITADKNLRTFSLGGQPAEVTLISDKGHTLDMRIWPLGFYKAYVTAAKEPHKGAIAYKISGDTACKEEINEKGSSYARKRLGSTASMAVRYVSGSKKYESTYFAFEVLDPLKVRGGTYSLTGYIFDPSVLAISTAGSGKQGEPGTPVTPVGPVIPVITLEIPQYFYLDFPYSAIALQADPKDDDLMIGRLPFVVDTNDPYSMTLQCGQSGASAAGNCNFGHPELELHSKVNFIQTGISLDLKHQTAVMVGDESLIGDDLDPLRSTAELAFELSGINKAPPGRIYSETINIVFESNY